MSSDQTAVLNWIHDPAPAGSRPGDGMEVPPGHTVKPRRYLGFNGGKSVRVCIHGGLLPRPTAVEPVNVLSFA